MRQLTTKKPKLITSDLKKIKLNNFVLKEEMGFSEEETKRMILNKPSILTKCKWPLFYCYYINFHCVAAQRNMLETFTFVHNTMEVPLETIAEFPDVLTHRKFKVEQRYLFLKMLNKIQFDPTKPLYISLLDIVKGTDAEFSTEVAKSSVQAFNAFLKTL